MAEPISPTNTFLSGYTRNLYRQAAGTVVSGANDALQYRTPNITGPSNNNTINQQQPAQAIAPGTIIYSSTWFTSTSDSRIGLTPDDNFTVYQNGNVFIQANSSGLGIYNNGTERVFLDNSGISYDGVLQPVTTWGEINGALGVWTLTPGYTLTKLSVGNYRVTHNFGSLVYTVYITPESGHFRGKVFNKTINSVDISFQQSDYSAGLYTGESPVDTSFNILFVRLP